MAEPVRLLPRIRTVIAVTIVAVLVWIFAEGESLQTERYAARVAFISGGTSEGDESPDLIVEALPGWAGTVTVELEGSNTSLAGMESLFATRVELGPGAFGGLVPTEPGEYEIDLVRVIEQLPGVAGEGLRVLSVQPERVGVRVLRLVDIELPVVTRLPTGSQGQGSAAPEVVRVRLPEGLAAEVGPEAVAIARVDRSAVDGLAPGRAVTISDVVLELPRRLLGERYVEASRRQVSVTVRLEAQTDQITLRSVPVWIKRPAFNAERVLLSLPVEDQTVSTVTVSGPSQLIAQIRDGSQRVFATVEVPAELLGDLRAERTVPVTLQFTDFESALEFSASKRTVSLTARPVVSTPATDLGEDPEDLGQNPGQETGSGAGGGGG